MGHKTIGRIWVFDEDVKDLGFEGSIIMEIVDAKQVVYEGT